MHPTILVILGSTRQGREGERIARWLMPQLEQRDDARYELVDLRDYPLPFFDTVSPMTGHRAPEAVAWAEKVASGDGYLVVSPEYNRSYPAVLKNAIDHLYGEWNHKPIGFLTYGAGSGGHRVAEHLRNIAVELQMVPIRDQVGIQLQQASNDDRGNPAWDDAKASVERMADQLRWWAQTLMVARSDTLAAMQG